MSHRTWAACALLIVALFAGLRKAGAQSPESATGDEAGMTVGGTFTAVHLQYGDHWILGGSGFVDAALGWHYGIEGETTWTAWHEQSGTHANTWLIGPRYQFDALGNYRYRPYIKLLAGYGMFHFPYNYAYGSYFVMAPGGGLDYRLNSRIRLRLVDVEYQYWPGFTYGSMSNLAVSTGIRYRIR